MINYFKARKLLTAAIIIILVITGYFTFQNLRPKSIQEKYNLETVTTTDITQTVVASGRIRSHAEVDLKFQTSGQLAWVGVKQGDQVQKWQAIASLDQRELQKTLEKELIDFSKQRHDFDEDKKVTYKNTTLTDTISRILDKNQWDLEKAVLDVELQDIALKYATIISPIDGIVTHIDVPVAGINITPATATFTIVDPKQLYFEAEIEEIDVGLIKPGQTVELILDAYPDQPLNLTISRLDFASSLSSDGGTVYNIVVELPENPNIDYLLGLNGEVTVTVAKKLNVVAIPFSSIDVDNNVQVVNNDQLITTPVTTGAFSEDLIEITSGLQTDQLIVVSQKK